jgi:hypothetical protein
MASPVIVLAARMFVSDAPAPRKFGPPESPEQVPPSPSDGFIEMRSQLLVVVNSPPVAT